MDKKTEQVLLQAYKDLLNYIHWLAGRTQIHNHWAMSADDIEAELLITLTKACIRYVDKPYDDLMRLLRASLYNQTKRLLYTHTITGRKNELYALSLDADDEYDDDNVLMLNAVADALSEELYSNNRNPEFMYQEIERLQEIIEQLDEFDKTVLDALLGGNDRVGMYLDLTRLRKDWVFKQPTISVNPQIVARALCESVSSVEESYNRIGSLFITTYNK